MLARWKQITTPGTAKLALTLAMLRRLIISIGFDLLTIQPATALDQVSLQLKWRHQFQFACYCKGRWKFCFRAAAYFLDCFPSDRGHLGVAMWFANVPPQNLESLVKSLGRGPILSV
jgi:hypothetical protein